MAKSEGQVAQHVWCWVHFRLVHSYFIALAFRSKETKFLVTTGDGKFYSNGIDLEWLNGCDSHEDTTKFIRGFSELLIRMMTFPMPTVAALNGERMCKLSNQDRTKKLQGEGLEHLSVPTCGPLIFLRNIPSFRMTKCSQKDEIYQISNAFPATIRNPNFKISHGTINPPPPPPPRLESLCTITPSGRTCICCSFALHISLLTLPPPQGTIAYLTLSLLSSKCTFSWPITQKMYKWGSENLYYNHLSSE